jgi:manganese/zinc/iron transport system substrate-binding protein
MVRLSSLRDYVLLVGVVAGLGGCSPSPNREADGSPVRVLATTGIVADLVKNVGGVHVAVTALMPPGVDPHRYTPRPGDATALAGADLVFFNGLHLEGKMVDVLDRTTVRGRKPVAVTMALDPARDLRRGEAGGDGPHDPHVWFDVTLWAKCVDPVRDALIAIDPTNADDYRRNADVYRQTLTALDRDVRDRVATLPPDRRILVTSHDAFHYFASAYGFEVKGLQGISTASDVGVDERRDLATYLIQKRVPAVFGETSVPTKGLQSVLDSVAASSGKRVRLVGGDDALYSDSLGEAGTPAATYVGMVRHNVDVIVKALSP